MHNKTELVPVTSIQHGDTIIDCYGNTKTVNKHHIKTGFMGTTIQGEQYRHGVERVLFKKYYRGELVGFVTQP